MTIKTEAPGHLAPWLPEKDPLVLAIVGKIGEEASELSKASSRAVIQGLEYVNHDGQPNLEKMIEEYCDVVAAFKVLRTVANITQEMEHLIAVRINMKEAHLLRWLQLMATIVKER